MGKWANYTIYDSAGRPIVSFKGMKVKKVKPHQPHQIGFRPPTDAVATTTVDVEVVCTCGEDHEEHYE